MVTSELQIRGDIEDNLKIIFLIIPPAYEVCQGVYSFRLSVRLSVIPWVPRPYKC